MTDVFEPIFDGSVLTRSVIATLKNWMPTYIQEVEVQRGYTQGAIPVPRIYTERNEFTTFADDMIPMVIVISPGLAGEPHHDGEGRYSGWWGLGIGVIAAANTEENSERLAKIYGACVRAIMLQHQALDEVWEYSGVQYLDETFIDVPDPEQQRTMRSARVVMRVAVENITNKWAGPDAPIPATPGPGDDWPTVETADAVVQRKGD